MINRAPVVPSEVEESRGENQRVIHEILRLRFAPLRMTAFCVRHSSFGDSSLLQPRYSHAAEAAGDFRHLGLCQRLALLDSLLDRV